MSKRAKQTTLTEMVETHNLLLSLNRLSGPPYDGGARWRRALYHALAMSGSTGRDMLCKIREALELP